MIEYLDEFNIVKFMKKHSLTIKVVAGKEHHRCYLFYGDNPVLRSNYAVYAFSKHNNKQDVLDAVSKEIVGSVIFFDGKAILVI